MTEQEKINGWTFEETVKTAENLMEVEKNMFKWDVLRHLRDFAENFKEELKQYRAIGTPEECRAAAEKQIPKKITHPGCFDNEGVWHTWNGIDGVPYDLCPNCETNLCTDGVFGRDKKKMKYCENCGQRILWEV